MKANYFMMTPLKEVVKFNLSGDDIFICGENDPLVPQAHLDLLKACDAKVYIMKGNHSLETGDVSEDLIQLQVIINLFKEYIK